MTKSSRAEDFPVGTRRSLEVEVTEAMIDAFALLSGDNNPLHMSGDAARAAGFPRRVAHGCLTLSFLSTLIGTRLPGDGALWRSVDVEWQRPVFPGDRVEISGEVTQSSTSAQSLVLRCEAKNQTGTIVMRATAHVSLTAELDASSTVAASAAAPTKSAPRATGRDSSPKALSGRAFLVTGGSRGIGAAIVESLAAAGFPVAVGFHKSEAEARAVVERAAEHGVSATAVHLDVSSGLVDGSALAQIEEQLGPIVGLVHAASPPIVYSELSTGSGDELSTYLASYVQAGLALVRHMRPAVAAGRWGRVIFLGTSYLLGPPPAKMGAYVTAKSALQGLVRSLAGELGPLGGTVNLVSPGLTPTDLSRDVSPRAQLAEAQRNPTRRLARVDDTAAVVAFVASEGAAYVNGAHIPVTGGMV